MNKYFPSVKVVGTYSPPFKDVFSEDDNEKMVRSINQVRPDVLWVGMTAPKQEKWIYEHMDKLDISLACAIGAVFDFYAETKGRAPEWVRRLGLEWLPRLINEPVRLFKRNFISSPLFLFYVFKQKFSQAELS
jgi:N-acetylglucosaminyldiphosphoundecaprenol N-acetyl-beta-D-mannosaminyltransferase